MTHSLQLSFDFLESTYVPQVCIFSGRQGPEADIAPTFETVVLGEGENVTLKQVPLPASARAASRRKFVDFLPVLTILFVVVILCMLTCMVIGSSSEMTRWATEHMKGQFKYLLIVIFIATVSFSFWAIRALMRSLFVLVSNSPDRKGLIISFPRRMESTYVLFKQAADAHVAAGSPKPVNVTAPPAAEKLADIAGASWDESTPKAGQ